MTAILLTNDIRRSLLLSLIVMTAVGIFAGCSGGGSSSSTPTPTPTPTATPTVTPTPTPTISTLQNDSFVTAGSATFDAGFVTGEAGAVVFAPQAKAYDVRNVQFLFGGDATPQTVTLTVYNDAGTDAPGTVLYSGDFALTPSDAALQLLDLTGQGISIAANARMRVAILFQHTGLPSIAHDSDGITAGRNFIYTAAAWNKAENLGLAGDFVIRAEISTPF